MVRALRGSVARYARAGGYHGEGTEPAEPTMQPIGRSAGGRPFGTSACRGGVTDSGSWKMVPKNDRLSGARVVLQNALDTCSTFGEKVSASRRTDRFLETIWEYGRTVLVFNPDVQGFTRQ